MRRSKSEMIFSVLEVLRFQPSAKITHVMYKVNVNCLILRSMLDILIIQGFVVERSSSVYSLTPKGLEFYHSLEFTMKALNNLTTDIERQRYIINAKAIKSGKTQLLEE